MTRLHQVLCIGLIGLALGGTAGAHRDRHHRGRDRDAIEGSGERVTQRRDVTGFDEIRLDCAGDLEIAVGPEFSVELTYDDNLIDLIDTDVRGGTLVLGCEEETEADDPCRVRISLPALAGVTLTGAGDIRVQGLAGKVFEYELRGAGNLDVSGTIERLEIRLMGAGDIDARDLIAQEVEVQLSGAGSVRVHAEESFDGRVSGCGTIQYAGDPPDAREAVSGIGSIRRR